MSLIDDIIEIWEVSKIFMTNYTSLYKILETRAEYMYTK